MTMKLIHLEATRLGDDSPMPPGDRARKIQKLKSRYKRLCVLADRERGDTINLRWYAVASLIQATLDRLEELGVDVEKELGD